MLETGPTATLVALPASTRGPLGGGGGAVGRAGGDSPALGAVFAPATGAGRAGVADDAGCRFGDGRADRDAARGGGSGETATGWRAGATSFDTRGALAAGAGRSTR